MEGGQTVTTIETVKSAVETALTGAGADMMDVLATIVPIALGVVVAILVVKKGIKIFKSLTGNN